MTDSVKVIEGFITEDGEPITFALATKISKDNVAFSQKAQLEGVDAQSITAFLSQQNNDIVKALGRLEHQLGVVSGRIIES